MLILAFFPLMRPRKKLWMNNNIDEDLEAGDEDVKRWLAM